MSYNGNSLYITWGGAIGNPEVDVWQCGLKISDMSALDAARVLPTAGQLETLLSDVIMPFHSSTATKISDYASVYWAKAAILDEEGHYNQEPVVVELPPIDGSGAATSASSPVQSMVISLSSGGSFGQANHGRFYLPWTTFTVSGDGTVDDGERAALRVRALTFLNEFSSWAKTVDINYQLVIMSKVGSGTTKVARVMRVGNVVDVQRRRRNKIVENYVSSELDN